MRQLDFFKEILAFNWILSSPLWTGEDPDPLGGQCHDNEEHKREFIPTLVNKRERFIVGMNCIYKYFKTLRTTLS